MPRCRSPCRSIEHRQRRYRVPGRLDDRVPRAIAVLHHKSASIATTACIAEPAHSVQPTLTGRAVGAGCRERTSFIRSGLWRRGPGDGEKRSPGLARDGVRPRRPERARLWQTSRIRFVAATAMCYPPDCQHRHPHPARVIGLTIAPVLDLARRLGRRSHRTASNRRMPLVFSPRLLAKARKADSPPRRRSTPVRTRRHPSPAALPQPDARPTLPAFGARLCSLWSEHGTPSPSPAEPWICWRRRCGRPAADLSRPPLIFSPFGYDPFAQLTLSQLLSKGIRP